MSKFPGEDPKIEVEEPKRCPYCGEYYAGGIMCAACRRQQEREMETDRKYGYGG